VVIDDEKGMNAQISMDIVVEVLAVRWTRNRYVCGNTF